MCCRRTNIDPITQQGLKEAAEIKPATFEELLQSLQKDMLGIEELRKRKEELLGMIEWKNPNKANLTKIKERSGNFANIMISQVKDMSRGLKGLIIINTKLEENVLRENKISK